MQFIETYFHFIAFFILILTSIIFVTFFLMTHKKEKTLFHNFHLVGLIVITIYEILHVLLIIYATNNVILRIYTIFLGVSFFMLVYVEIIYLISTMKKEP
ncbi:MAG: hypothetical protein IJU60_01165 [Acholeplasmatales bacterium]|nr:hypothetical protein [Acholeplasmatales bacterium]